jgi:hypothetical protein
MQEGQHYRTIPLTAARAMLADVREGRAAAPAQRGRVLTNIKTSEPNREPPTVSVSRRSQNS